MITDDQNRTLLDLTVQIVSAHLSRNQTAAEGLPSLIEQVYGALSRAGTEPAAVPAEKQQPFVPAKRSIFPDYIICLEDGRKLKTLKRHLRSTFNLSPEQYREKWGLAPDYPMVAPNYAEHRSRLAKELGLGRKPAAAEAPNTRESSGRDASASGREKEAPAAKETKRRADHSAASVFAKFPKNAAPEAEEAAPAKKTRGRKPFSKQLARSMRQ